MNHLTWALGTKLGWDVALRCPVGWAAELMTYLDQSRWSLPSGLSSCGQHLPSANVEQASP